MGRNSSQAVIESTPSVAAIIERRPVPVPMSSTCTLTSKVSSNDIRVLDLHVQTSHVFIKLN